MFLNHLRRVKESLLSWLEDDLDNFVLTPEQLMAALTAVNRHGGIT
jgi:hypothetical protein